MSGRRLPPGVARTPYGFRVFVRLFHGPGGLKSKRFPRLTPLAEMKAWQQDQRDTYRRTPIPVPHDPPSGFAADATTYLQARRAMPSFADRARDIAYWVARFEDTPTGELTSAAIRTARDEMLVEGPKYVQVTRAHQKATWVPQRVPLAASTVNHRLRALENLFTVLYPDLPNPVREVPEAIEPDEEPRGQTFALALEILAHMPDVTRPVKDGAVERGSLSRVRFEALLWTGLTASQLAKLTPAHLNVEARTLLVPTRQKGRRSRRSRRSRPRPPRPLLPQAVDALQRLFALGANRPFSSESLGRSLRRAIRAANRIRTQQGQPLISERLTVYELTRHTYASEAYRATGDLKAVQELLGHADIAQTERYALAAVHERTAAAITRLSTALNQTKAAGIGAVTGDDERP